MHRCVGHSGDSTLVLVVGVVGVGVVGVGVVVVVVVVVVGRAQQTSFNFF